MSAEPTTLGRVTLSDLDAEIHTLADELARNVSQFQALLSVIDAARAAGARADDRVFEVLLGAGASDKEAW